MVAVMSMSIVLFVVEVEIEQNFEMVHYFADVVVDDHSNFDNDSNPVVEFDSVDRMAVD